MSGWCFTLALYVKYLLSHFLIICNYMWIHCNYYFFLPLSFATVFTCMFFKILSRCSNRQPVQLCLVRWLGRNSGIILGLLFFFGVRFWKDFFGVCSSVFSQKDAFMFRYRIEARKKSWQVAKLKRRNFVVCLKGGN